MDATASYANVEPERSEVDPTGLGARPYRTLGGGGQDDADDVGFADRQSLGDPAVAAGAAQEDVMCCDLVPTPAGDAYDRGL